ncbi:sideroflexin-2 isoform X2 [Culex pipiens pallens]|uniref:sideroflexin-2 isoform X2 n=1 Tax=Culex pipiens pallens TaxID=42434 RepID=UPI0022AAD93F|nr:sideroflexin-2 isoform X2 [Culex pipiens pallens]
MVIDADVENQPWDLKTFSGRFKYFLWVTDPRTCLTPEEELMQARQLILNIGNGKKSSLSENEINFARKLYESAFHPDTGDLQNIFGRMSFQMPGGMAITGAMLQWYRSNTAVIFWQWVNQSFNALVNYTNRNANSSLSTTQLFISYVSATSAALVAAVGYKKYLTKTASPFFQRYVPFVAVAVANCINIPLMRQNEILYGIHIHDEEGNIVGKSRLAAVKGICQVVLSRIVMCAPGMLVLPMIMESLEKFKAFRRISYLHGPFQVVAVGCLDMFDEHYLYIRKDSLHQFWKDRLYEKERRTRCTSRGWSEIRRT